MAAVVRTQIGPRVQRFKQGDRGLSLYWVAEDWETMESVNLMGFTACQFVFRKRTDAPAAAITGAGVVVTPETGELRYDWAAGNTDIAGEYYGEFKVTLVTGLERTFPQKGYILFVIEKDLNT